MNWHWTHQHLRRIHHKCDSIGINYYMHKKLGDTATYEKTDMGWDVYPEGLCEALLMVRRYGGLCGSRKQGSRMLPTSSARTTLRGLSAARIPPFKRALTFGALAYWSLMDNYELAQGYTKRFGLVEVDFETLERKVRPSAYVYRRIIEQNGLVE